MRPAINLPTEVRPPVSSGEACIPQASGDVGATSSLRSQPRTNDRVHQQVAALENLRHNIERPPAVPIEDAAKLLQMSVRTLYRRRAQFEHRRQHRHLYFTLRGIQEHIEMEQYNPTASFDISSTRYTNQPEISHQSEITFSPSAISVPVDEATRFGVRMTYLGPTKKTYTSPKRPRNNHSLS